MDETVFTPLKGITFLVAVFLLFYSFVLAVQLVTGTVTASIAQVAVLLALSLLAWAWMVRRSRNAEFERVEMVESG